MANFPGTDRGGGGMGTAGIDGYINRSHKHEIFRGKLDPIILLITINFHFSRQLTQVIERSNCI